jgi:hypothetical protein
LIRGEDLFESRGQEQVYGAFGLAGLLLGLKSGATRQGQTQDEKAADYEPPGCK